MENSLKKLYLMAVATSNPCNILDTIPFPQTPIFLNIVFNLLTLCPPYHMGCEGIIYSTSTTGLKFGPQSYINKLHMWINFQLFKLFIAKLSKFTRSISTLITVFTFSFNFNISYFKILNKKI